MEEKRKALLLSVPICVHLWFKFLEASVVTLRILDSDAPDSAPGPFAAVEARLLRELDTGEAGVANALDALFSAAVRHGVGDIHIEPWADATSVRWRVDGLLHEVARLPRQHHAKIAARTKILAKITVYQRDVPQDGRIDADATPCGQAMRVSLFPTVHGEKIVVRVLGAQGEIPALDALGFDAAIATRLREIVARPQGTLLLTGPSSSGKTTTIYALLQEIARVRGRAAHIVTIEDPVECKLPGVSQTQIAPGSGFTFDAAFRAILRQDPEVIMLGEIRDAETARLAVQAGLTGHLVISTIHSGTAAGVFTRLLDMGIEPFLVASSVTGVLAQRLVRVVCPECRRRMTPPNDLCARYGAPEINGEWHEAIGCETCKGIGYTGRTAIGEALRVNEELAELVLSRSRTRTVHDVALRQGMIPLERAALHCAARGITTVEELQRVLPPVEG